MKRFAKQTQVVLIISGVALLAACGSEVAGGADTSRPGASASVVALKPATQTLVNQAYARLASGNGDASSKPKWQVRSNLGRAERAVSGSSSSSRGSNNSLTPVVVVEGVGKFSGAMEKRPAGASPQAGHYLTVIIRTDDGTVLGWGLRNEKSPLSSLGSVITPG